MSWLEFLQAQKYSSSGRVHVAPNIPKKLLSNALSAYGLTVDPSEVVVLIDDTMFASGKDGCLIGQEYLAVREGFSDAMTYAYDEVDALELKGSKLFLNERQAIAFNMPDKDDLHECFSLLQKWLRTRGGEQLAPVAKPAAVKASAGNQELSAEQVDSIVQMTLSLAERLGLERVYVRPHIPQKKLSAALESYGANMSGDEVLVLIDDTLFGGAKEGVLMGESKLAVKMVFDTPRLFFWRHLDSLAVEKSDLFVNSRKVGTFTQVGEKELGEFFSVINKALGDARRGLAAQPAVAPPAVAVGAAKPKVEPALVKPVAEEILALAVIKETTPDDPQKKVSDMDKLLGYVAVAIEQNKSKILPFIKDKTGEASLAALRDDSNVEKLGGFIYAFLPGVVRLALKEETFVRFVLDNRNKLLDKLLAGEAERVAALQDITPTARLAPTYHAELDDLLMDDEPVVQPGQRAIEKMQAILADLKQEQHDDPDSAFIWQLSINYLGAVIPKAKKLIGCPDEEIEEQIFFVLALMYGFSFHKIPESIRQQDGLLEGFMTGFLMVCENYRERSPQSKVTTEDVEMLMAMAMAMAKMATKQQLNEMVRKMLDEHKGGAKPGEFEVDDIMLLLRAANGFAQQWVDNLTREIIAEERALQNKWGDLLN